MLKQLTVKTIVSDSDSRRGNYVVYLYHKKEKIILPVKVGPTAGENIIIALQNSPIPRPHTHDTAIRMVKALSGKIASIILTDCQGEIFYSYIRLINGNRILDIDSKPSDAISIAVRSGAPIYAEKNLLDKAGIKLTEELLKKYI